MPREVLSEAPEAGFFGKLPALGDFVARGVPRAFRNHWDAWVTWNLAQRLRDAAPWPVGGLRFRLVSGGRMAAGVVVPGGDSAGRVYPLTLLVISAHMVDALALDAWCDAALVAAGPAMMGNMGPDDLLDALDAVPPPQNQPAEPLRAANTPEMTLWTKAMPPTACDATAAGAAIDRAFALSCS